MTAPPDDGSVEADGVDEQDMTAMQVAIGAALTAMFLAWLMPGMPSIFGNRQSHRKDQLEAAIGMTLRSFIARSTTDFAQAARSAGVPNAYAIAATIAPEVYADVLRTALQWADESYRHFAAHARQNGVADTMLNRRDPVRTSVGGLAGEANDLAAAAGESVARSVAAYARNESRDRVAQSLGALWSGWKSRRDNRVRDTHQSLNGLWVPFGGRFVSESGALLRFPGDPEAPPSETMGCRCRLVYRFRPKGSSFEAV